MRTFHIPCSNSKMTWFCGVAHVWAQSHTKQSYLAVVQPQAMMQEGQDWPSFMPCGTVAAYQSTDNSQHWLTQCWMACRSPFRNGETNWLVLTLRNHLEYMFLQYAMVMTKGSKINVRLLVRVRLHHDQLVYESYCVWQTIATLTSGHPWPGWSVAHVGTRPNNEMHLCPLYQYKPE